MMKGFVDFEFNQGKHQEAEIISIGAVILNEEYQEVGRFSSLVKPTKCLTLNPFISELTGIQQESLDGAEDFVTVATKFDDFVSQFGKVKFFCWGNFDNKAILTSSRINNCDILQNAIGFLVNIQGPISCDIRYNGDIVSKNLNLGLARKFYNLCERSEHDALEDALMLADVYVAHKQRGVYNYPDGYQNCDDTTVSNAVIQELVLKVKNGPSNVYLNDHERCISLLKYTDGGTYSEAVMNRSIFDTARKSFMGNNEFIKNEINVPMISYDDLGTYKASVSINTDDNSATVTITDGQKSSIIFMRVSTKNRQRIKRILQKLKGANAA